MEEIEQKKKRRLEIAESRKRYQVMHCQKQYEEAEYMADCEFMVLYYEFYNNKSKITYLIFFFLIKNK
jgi:hypothetical protein